jgi:Tfp pilus assembly protein PilW
MMAKRLSERGTTVIELLVACVVSIIFIMVAATGYLVNQKAYAANKDKLELQQAASHVMEIMERRIREAYDVDIPAGMNANNRITIKDENGATVTLFRLNANGPEVRLFEVNTELARQDLINLQFIPNSDTTVVQIELNFQDMNLNKVAIRGSAALRNHPKLRYLEPAPAN